jgi:hypothetical protein
MRTNHHFHDPRPFETLQEAVAPGYDEDGNSLSNPLPPHRPRLSQFDTQIWEMCDVTSSKVLMPHRDSSSIPYHYQLQPIMNWAGVNVEQAEIIKETGQALNATMKMMREFCKQAKDDFKAFLCEMTPLVDGLTEVEESFEKPWMPEIPASIKINKEALQTLYQMLGDQEDDEEEIEPKETSSTIGYHVFEDFARFNKMRSDLWRWYQDHYVDNIPDGMYQKLQELSNDELEELWYKKFNWIRQQGSKFVKLLTGTRQGDRKKIGELANDVMEDRIKLSKIQKSVFFTEFNIRKNYLEKNTDPIVQRMIRKIYNSDGRLGFIGVQLHKIQSKEIPFKHNLQKWEWNKIWSAYFLEKELRETKKEVNKLKKELTGLWYDLG